MKKTTFKIEKNWLSAILMVILLGTVSCNQSTEQESAADEMKAPTTTILEATFMGNEEAVKEHIAYKSDLNQKDAYGSTPLHIAATFGKTDVAILLIEAGADLSATSADGSTPLHTAAFFGRTEIVKALLANNINVTVRNNYGSTAYESVSTSFVNVKPIYDQLSKDLGPLGLKLDYAQLESARPIIAEMIMASSK